MKTVFKVIVVLGLIATASVVPAEIYKWVDDKGTIHFTEDPARIPEKYRSQIESRKTEEDYMTPEERIRANQEKEMRAKEILQQNKEEYQRLLKEENKREAERQRKKALEEKRAEREEQIRKMEEAIKQEENRKKEEEESYKSCYNCGGDGRIGVKVLTRGGGSTNIDKTCEICGGTGKLKK